MTTKRFTKTKTKTKKKKAGSSDDQSAAEQNKKKNEKKNKKKKKKKKQKTAAQKKKKEKKKKKKKKKGEGGGGEHGAAAYMKLDNLTVNLSGGKDHFLAVSMELKLAEPEAQVHLTERLPEVKNLVLITLSAQTPDSLSSVDGKNALAQKLRDDLNALIDEDEETGVENVFFTQFIIQ